MRLHLACCLLLAALPVSAQTLAPKPAALQQQAEAAYKAGRFAESAALLNQAISMAGDQEKPRLEYNAACAQSLAGEHDDALLTLSHAAEDGYTDAKGTAADKDLLALHADPRWPAILARMQGAEKDQAARWGDAAFATPFTANLPDADKLAGLAELWAQAKYGFANFWHVPSLNWDAAYRDAIPQVLATKSTFAYYQRLQQFYALLQDGHSGVYFPEAIYKTMARLPLRTRMVDGRLLFLSSRAENADLQGLRPGDEIVSINGEPAAAWARLNVAPYVSASTPQDRDTRTYEYLLFLARVSTTFTLQTASPAGSLQTHKFIVTADTAAHRSLFDFRMLPGNIAYVALKGFDDDTAAKQWDAHWPEISRASAIVLDLRENGGGSDSVGAHILGTLLDKPAQGELSRSTRWIATYRAWGVVEAPVRFPVGTVDPDPQHHFAGPVVALASARTFSAGEDFLVVFRQARRGAILGEATGGSTGQPLSFSLPGGGSARICTKHDSYANGDEFVGVGIQPDIAVHATRADIVKGRDPVLEAAVARLSTAR